MPRPLKNKLPPLSQEDIDIGENITRYRKQKGLTQVQLAAQIGITQKLISDYETGRVRLNAEMIIRLSQALEVSSDTILGISPVEDASPVSLKISQRMRKIESLPPFDQKALLKTIDNALKGAGMDSSNSSGE
ncbi:helix-turn-helix domain-containing protein [Spirochaeta isovalerica]|uniref:Transcriptional regulator with XRE-family HTH domain n=1 Tax=Spirochaeta isovalerica TaxID=150 RepID=A0A841R500_9SPIO|nr:helix-turn-helix transcriptional regulator [Spirochaeta isovalerica]MBB6478471.1 transcriptional regulator with XRE-family HTH domain [Spirochaeta isovalerica]